MRRGTTATVSSKWRREMGWGMEVSKYIEEWNAGKENLEFNFWRCSLAIIGILALSSPSSSTKWLSRNSYNPQIPLLYFLPICQLPMLFWVHNSRWVLAQNPVLLFFCLILTNRVSRSSQCELRMLEKSELSFLSVTRTTLLYWELWVLLMIRWTLGPIGFPVHFLFQQWGWLRDGRAIYNFMCLYTCHTINLDHTWSMDEFNWISMHTSVNVLYYASS